MVHFREFAVEKWMDDYETAAKYNLAETCCSSLSMSQLSDLSESKVTLALDPTKKLDYGTIRGSPELVKQLARLYSVRANSALPESNILITPGAISANFLLLYTLVGPGDHIVCHYPTYQQLYSFPESLGAEVSLWKASPTKDWIPDIDELKSLIRPNTKLIVINNPNNPSGAILSKSLLEQIIELAEPKSIPILCDEVYRPLFHSISPVDPNFPPSLLSMGYPLAIVTGSLSKAYSLAGIRVGWLASRSQEIIERCASARHYSTISVSQLDQQVAAFALSPDVVHGLLSRNIALARRNLELLHVFLDDMRRDGACEWVRPKAGTTVFVKFKGREDGRPVDAVAFCKSLQKSKGAMFLPGNYGFGAEWRGYVRIGFCAVETEVLKRGLDEVRRFMRKEYDELPLMDEYDEGEKDAKIEP